MQRSVAACARSVVVHDRSAATRISPKHAIADVSSAAHLRRCSIGSSSAAGVVPAVDDSRTTALGVRAVDTPHDGSIATAVARVVVELVSAAGRSRAVDSVHHPAPATDGSADVVARGTTAASVRAIGPGSADTVAAHLGPGVVDGPAAATGVQAIGPGSRKRRCNTPGCGSYRWKNRNNRCWYRSFSFSACHGSRCRDCGCRLGRYSTCGWRMDRY